MSRNKLADQMLEQLLPAGCVAEYRFHPTRKWRFDYAWPEYRIALEVEGAIWTGGRHTSGAGYSKDIEKYNAAVLCGWRLLRITRNDFNCGRAGRLIEEAIHILTGEH